MQQDSNTKAQIVLVGAAGGIGQYLVQPLRGQHEVIDTSHANTSAEQSLDVPLPAARVQDRAGVTSFGQELAPTPHRPLACSVGEVGLRALAPDVG